MVTDIANAISAISSVLGILERLIIAVASLPFGQLQPWNSSVVEKCPFPYRLSNCK
jgi:hypothetical protein